MDVTDIIDPLNDPQREAVTAPDRPTLVLAGAGSGKTRVLVHRIAWVIRVGGVAAQHVLAVTFTNKAAAEMRDRVEALLGMPTRNLWIGTFHGLSHRLLRIHWREAGLTEGFQIMDSEDQQRMIRRMLRALELDENVWVPKEIQWFINAQKDEGLRPKDLRDEGNAGRRQMIDLYARYEQVCAAASVIDFGELLLRSLELLRDNLELQRQYQQRFQHVLVDEFQDTNAIQYRWLRLLAGPAGTPFVVGDDDQSIYRWRGARVENLYRFQQDYAGTQVVRLEQNYRSTATILNAANAVIANNSSRLGKTLWTDGPAGAPIKLYAAFNERDEAEFVINRIQDHIDQGGKRSEAAVLYRSNAQSRVFEEGLLAAGIPYRVYGGLRFFERAEIKDALAYLRLVMNRDDDPSFERVVNTPPRGIGARTVEAVREHARATGTSLWRAAAALIAEDTLAKRAAESLWGFLNLVETLETDTRGDALHEQVARVIERSGLIAHHGKNAGRRRRGARREPRGARQRRARGHARRIDRPAAARGVPRVRRARVRRRPGRRLSRQRAAHDAALGEGARVLAAVPLRHGGRPVSAPALAERSRRSRGGAAPLLRRHHARQARAVSHARGAAPSARRRDVRDAVALPARDSRRAHRGGAPGDDRLAAHLPARVGGGAVGSGVRLGQRVRHGKFGEGIVLNSEGSGAHARVQVNFEGSGTKWLVVAYANLELM